MKVNGITALALNHLDTIGKLDKIKVCVEYDHNGERIKNYTTNEKYLSECKPVYKEFEGNFGNISNINKREDLPEKAQEYLKEIEEYVGVPIKFIGTGPRREDMIINE